MSELLPQMAGYEDLLRDLKSRIRTAQIRAASAVNRELVLLYWQIGTDILKREQEQGWGKRVITRLSLDLRQEFPEMKGFSPRNLTYMRDFAAAWPEESILQQLVAKLPWGHNVRLIDYVKDYDERLWYVRQAVENGWSRNVLAHQIQSGLYHRQGKALSNFARTLPAPQSDLAQQLLKDPYTFDFLSLGANVQERELQRGLLQHLRDFLLELGVGFAFLGSEYNLEVDGDDYYLDLLFYHVRLHCYVVLELKMGKFKPEYAGKMNFYLSAVDDLLRQPEDGASIGIILCNDRGRVAVEYALRDLAKPIGISTYQLTRTLPDNLQRNLPTIEALEAELAGMSESVTD